MVTNAYITANTLTAYVTRRERLNGVDYLVAPAVLLVEGVHQGSAGPILYPLNELKMFPSAWDGRPVTLGHPEVDGEPVSASNPRAIEEFSLGMLLHTRYDVELRGLRSEVWLNVDRARTLAPDVLETMQRGEPLEISTGLWFEAQGGPGTWNTEAYDTTAVGFRPDHLALLPGAVGACSISDGCGLRANKEKGGGTDATFNVRARARRPSFEGTESSAWGAPSWAQVVAGYNRATGSDVESSVSVGDAPQPLKEWAARLSLLGDEGADNFRDLVFFPVVNLSNGKLNERALRAVIGGRGSQADIPAAARDSAQALARRMLNSEFDAGLEVGNMDKGFMTFLRNYFQKEIPKEELVAQMLEGLATNQPGMVSTARDLQRHLDAMDRDVPNGRLVHWLEEAFDDGSFVMRQEGPEGTKFFRGKFMATENEGVEVDEGDFTEVRLRKEFVDVAANNKEGDEGSTTQTTNKEEGNVSDDKKKTLVDNLIGCGKTAFNEDHREGLMAMNEGALEALKAKETSAAAPAGAAPQAPAGNEAKKPVTLEEAVASLPDEYKGTIEEAIAANDKRKEEMVDNILAAPGNTFTKDVLMAKNLSEVEAIASIVKGDTGEEAPGGNQEPEKPVSYAGKVTGNTAPAGNQEGDDAPLGRPLG